MSCWKNLEDINPQLWTDKGIPLGHLLWLRYLSILINKLAFIKSILKAFPYLLYNTTRKKYNVPVGLSDHSTDPILAPAIAVAYGAIAIEKHFTLDKTLPGPDHSFALNPNELKLMVQSIRKAENSVGSGIKNVLDIEKELSSFARRSIQATTKIRKGDEFVEGVNFDILRPGKKSRRIEPRFLNSLNGKKAKIDIDIGEGITENSWKI